MAVNETVAKYVQAGARFLDEVQGDDWPNNIDLDDLDMFCCERCVLGQLYGDINDGSDELGLRNEEWVTLGFDIPGQYWLEEGRFPEMRGVEYEELEALWKKEILLRKELMYKRLLDGKSPRTCASGREVASATQG